MILDPRRWTLLNGKDTASRADIEALLGLGPKGLRVDNAASCVVACVNTQRRDVARKRAGEVLAWRYVIRQIDDTDDELTEARAKLTEVEAKLKGDIAKAFQHYAYLVRAGALTVEFKRFDEDSRSSLRGDNVWTQLVADGRATIPGGLASDYVAALLEGFDRTLTPKEIVQAFYKNPSFPLVPSTDEIRTVIFNLVNGDWELVDSDGNRLAVASLGQIQINSISQAMQRRTVEPDQDTPSPTTKDPTDQPNGSTPFTDGSSDGGTNTPAPTSPVNTPTSPPMVYKRYTVELANRSITSPENRDQVWQLLKELAKVIDPANTQNPDHQLINLKVTLTTLETHQGGVVDKAQQIGAKVSVEEDDF